MNRTTRKLITRHLPKILLVGLIAVSVGMLIACGHVADLMMAGMLGMAVTANQLIKRQDGNRISYPAAATTRIYEGTLVFINATGYADDDTATGANEFGGIAIRDVNNTGSAGDLQCECWRTGVFELVGAGTFTQADVGKTVYATDNYTITLTGGGSGVPIGNVARFVSDTVLAVEIEVAGAGSQLAGDGATFVPFVPMAAPQALSGAGAINVTSYYTAWTTTGAQAGTLADGVQVGQLKKIQLIVDGGDGTLTPANLAGGTTITFADAGDFALLVWNGVDWVAIELGNDADGATAPVLA